MKNVRKLLVCLALVCCLSVGTIGCGRNSDINVDDTDVSNSDIAANADVSQDDDNTADDSNSDDDSQEVQTDEDGNIVTTTGSTDDEESIETVAMTDSNGNVVTDEDGNVVTQKVVKKDSDDNSNSDESSDNVTTQTDSDGNVVTNSADTTTKSNSSNNGNSSDSNNNNNNNNNSSSNNNNNSNSDDDDDDDDSSIYFAKNLYTVLLWMSDDTSDYYESGAIAEVTFKVLDTAENGDYSITFNDVEICNNALEDLPFTVQNGTITVGKEKSVTAQGAATSGANFRIDNATAQPGDTVKLTIYLDNNPGMCLYKLELKYDGKALEVQSVSSAGNYSSETIEHNLNNDKSTKR